MTCPGRWVVGALVAAVVLIPAPASAQDSVTIVPGDRYSAGWLHRFFLGAGYRKMWTTPIRVPVLDLATYAGGLTPVRRGGGQQTTSLRLRAPDGREFSFRSVDKDPTSLLPEELQRTGVIRILRDQISSAHPVGALVVSELLDAVGVLNPEPVLAVMPDDPRLGEFRAEFAGMLGMIEVRPDENEDEDVGFAGAINIVGSEKFLEEIENNPFVRPDARAFLRARLMDVFVGDWDRHRGQWRWALTDQDGPRRWMPIPRDRDQAFVKFDGLLLYIAREHFPQFVNFGSQYAVTAGQTWNGRDLDRWILPNLTWPEWEEVATELQGLLTDGVIDAAVDVLPEPFKPLERDRMVHALRSRRDDLVREAGRYYRMLARQVDIHGSDLRDSTVVTRLEGGRVRVQLWADTVRAPYYDRTFDRDETRDLRVWFHGDDDRGVIRGEGGGPTVRFLGGGSDDHFVDEARGGRTRFYDDRGTNTAEGGSIQDKPWITESDTVPGVLPPRDWGSRLEKYFLLSFGPDVGLVPSARLVRMGYGFRKRPQANRLALSAGWATGANAGNVALEGDWWEENSGVRWGFRARTSGIEVLRWYGKGNETSRGPSDAFNRLSQQVLALETHYGVDFGANSTFEIGPAVKFSHTDLDDGDNSRRFIAIDRPLGIDNFGQLGATTSLLLDGRDRAVGASHGAMLRVAGSVFPIADNDPFGSVEGEAAGYWSPKGKDAPTFALRVGGRKVWGDYPFFEAATVGGNTSRGFRAGRFAGDGAVWANGEVRVKLMRARLLLPGDLGVFGFGDVGRVWLDGEDSDKWQPSAGGGVWFGILHRHLTVSLSAGRSREETLFYFGTGFGF